MDVHLILISYNYKKICYTPIVISPREGTEVVRICCVSSMQFFYVCTNVSSRSKINVFFSYLFDQMLKLNFVIKAQNKFLAIRIYIIEVGVEGSIYKISALFLAFYGALEIFIIKDYR